MNGTLRVKWFNVIFYIVKGTQEYKQKQSSEVFYEKKMFLKISQNSQENTCIQSLFFNKVDLIKLTS